MNEVPPGSGSTVATAPQSQPEKPKDEQEPEDPVEKAKGHFSELAVALDKLYKRTKDQDEKLSYFLFREEVQDIQRQFITHVALIREPSESAGDVHP